MFIMGVGSRWALTPPRYWYSDRPADSAAARATASDTPRIALAPSLVLLGGTVRGDQRGIDSALVEGIEAHDGIGALVVDVLDGLRDALAQVATLVAVAQLACLKGAGRSARRHHCAAKAAVLEHDLDLYGGVAAAVEHLATVDIQNVTHVVSLSLGNGLNAWRPADRAPSVRLCKLAMSHFLHYALS